jgi:hypothetical protein
MTPHAWNLAIAVSGSAALVWLVRYLVVNVRRGSWTSASTLIVAAATAVMMPLLIGDFAHGILSSTDAFGEPILVYDGWVSQLQRSFTLLFFVGAVAFAIWSLARGRTPHTWAAVVAAGCVMLADVGNLAVGAKVTDPPLLALAAALLAAGWCRGPVGVGVGGVTVIVSVLGISGLVGFLDPETVWKACRPDKCSPANALYQGLLVHENTMGLLVAPAIPFVVFGTRGRARALLLVFLIVVELATGSRSGQLAAVAALGGSLLLVTKGRSRWVLMAHGLAWIVAGVGAVACLAPLFIEVSDQSFTARGELWRIARHRIPDSWLWGHGSLGWRTIYESEGLFADSSTYSPHNQVLDVAFTIGLLGLALMICIIVMTLVQAKTSRPFAIAILIGAVWLGILERPWSFSGLDWLSWTLLGFLLLGNAKPRQLPAGAKRRRSRERVPSDYRPTELSSAGGPE